LRAWLTRKTGFTSNTLLALGSGIPLRTLTADITRFTLGTCWSLGAF
jgi:hypothetical protein